MAWFSSDLKKKKKELVSAIGPIAEKTVFPKWSGGGGTRGISERLSGLRHLLPSLMT